MSQRRKVPSTPDRPLHALRKARRGRGRPRERERFGKASSLSPSVQFLLLSFLWKGWLVLPQSSFVLRRRASFSISECCLQSRRLLRQDFTKSHGLRALTTPTNSASLKRWLPGEVEAVSNSRSLSTRDSPRSEVDLRKRRVSPANR